MYPAPNGVARLFRSRVILGWQRFGGRKNSWFLFVQNEWSQDKLARWTIFESVNCYYNYFLIYPTVDMGTKSVSGFDSKLHRYFL